MEKIKTPFNKCLYHPYEICFAGLSGTGKTTLISKLIRKLSNEGKLNVAYVKHDAHHFEIDQEGKDTWVNYQAGAQQIFISDTAHWATVNHGHIFPTQKTGQFSQIDVAIVEGHKSSEAPKLLFIDEKGEIISRLDKGEITDVIAFVVPSEKDLLDDKWVSLRNRGLPFFTRDDVEGIYQFLFKQWDKMTTKDIFALILVGGKSSRMGTDKSALNYRGKSQIEYLHEIVTPFVSKVFVSCRAEQSNLSHLASHQQIRDSFLDMGPFGGIFSALREYPQNPWLVLACDLPFLDAEHIKNLLEKRNPFKAATAYFNPAGKRIEPLCAIYEPKMFTVFGQFLANGNICPSKVMMNSSVQSLSLLDERALDNANTPEEFHLARGRIKSKEST